MQGTTTQISARTPTIASINPATGEMLREFLCAGRSEIEESLLRARKAQETWAKLPVDMRLRVVESFQRILLAKKDEVCDLITREAGKPQVEALLAEVMVVLDTAKFLRRNAERFLAPEKVPHASLAMKTKKGYLLKEPHGVVAVISPWNYPFSIPATEILAAVVCGNAVILKPSELTSMTAQKLKEIFDLAGLPRDVLQVMIGSGATGSWLVQSGVDKVVFTGSVATGKKIAAHAAETLVPVVLELGGKDPMIVLEDADLDVASSAAVWGAFMNAGQTCLSVERCYVHRKVYDEFLSACVEKTKVLRVGNGSELDVDLGPLIREQQVKVVEEHVQDALMRGAKAVVGGRTLPELGPNFYAPTILVDVDHSMKVMQQETFGPLLPIMTFETESEAVFLANDSDFGLAASVFTKNRSRGEALARRLQAGTVMVNDLICAYGISEAPHGGLKQSGIGRTHGLIGLQEMVRVKYVDSELVPQMKKLWWFRYGNEFRIQMSGFVDFLFGRSQRQRLAAGWKARGAFRKK